MLIPKQDPKYTVVVLPLGKDHALDEALNNNPDLARVWGNLSLAILAIDELSQALQNDLNLEDKEGLIKKLESAANFFDDSIELLKNQ
ncbi:MAG: hypothetical protein F6K16_32865 [Symploca sp. SIO2B6]|nr:hypothetical protein [Symploca sp. SIO2B6]